MLKPTALVVLVVVVAAHGVLLGYLSHAGISAAIVITVAGMVVVAHALRRLRR